jgi:holo-[acyl-carrier protein] synthase
MSELLTPSVTSASHTSKHPQTMPSELLKVVDHQLQIVKVQRIRDDIKCSSQQFEAQHFTLTERNTAQSSADPMQYFAGRFAAKIAILKIFELNESSALSWLEIEIQRRSTGEPWINLCGNCQILAHERGIAKWLLSISHTASYAVASAIAMTSTEGGLVPQVL